MTASGESERPARIEVGQRYEFEGDVYRVTAAEGKLWRITWERPDGPEVPQAGVVRIDESYHYLGGSSSPVPQEGPGVRAIPKAGERWRDMQCDCVLTVAEGPMHPLLHWPIVGDQVRCTKARNSIHIGVTNTAHEFIAPAPSVTPAAPAKRCHHCGASHAEKLGLCAPCDAALEAEVVTPATLKPGDEPARPLLPGERCGRGANHPAGEHHFKRYRSANPHGQCKHVEAPAPVYGRLVGEMRNSEGVPLTALQHIQARKEPEPYVCPVDDWDLLPGVDERGWR